MEIFDESIPKHTRPSFHQDHNLFSNGVNTPKKKCFPKKHATTT